MSEHTYDSRKSTQVNHIEVVSREYRNQADPAERKGAISLNEKTEASPLDREAAQCYRSGMPKTVPNAQDALDTAEPQPTGDLKQIRRIAFVGHDNSGSRRILEQIRDAYPAIEAKMVVTTGLYYRRSVLGSIFRLIRESSVRFCAARALDMVRARIAGYTLANYCRTMRIPALLTADANDPKTLAFLREFEPDLIVSLYTMHILREPLISLPRFGTITGHPSILPEYRGLEVFFWQMANGEPNSGVSIFRVTPKVDYGAVLNQQIVPISRSETMASLYEKITVVAAALLVKSIGEIDAGTTVERPALGTGSYYGMPTRAAVRKFRRAGRRFW